MSNVSKVIGPNTCAQTDRQRHTDFQTNTHTDMTKALPLPHMWEVINSKMLNVSL